MNGRVGHHGQRLVEWELEQDTLKVTRGSKMIGKAHREKLREYRGAAELSSPRVLLPRFFACLHWSRAC